MTTNTRVSAVKLNMEEDRQKDDLCEHHGLNTNQLLKTLIKEEHARVRLSDVEPGQRVRTIEGRTIAEVIVQGEGSITVRVREPKGWKQTSWSPGTEVEVVR